MNLDKLLELENEQFIKKCFAYIQSLNLSENQLKPLWDLDLANQVIKDRNRFTYPIIKEVSSNLEVTDTDYKVKGTRRYYSDKFLLNGKYYILCNDWYYPSKEKKNTKDTRTPFIKWIKTLAN